MHLLGDNAEDRAWAHTLSSDHKGAEPFSLELDLKSRESCRIRRLLGCMEQYDRTTWLLQFESFLQEALRIVRADLEGRRFAVLHADMQGFQVLNRIYGEQAGNSMLRAFAAFLRHLDCYLCGSRIFADQFAMLFTVPTGMTLEAAAGKVVAKGELFLAEKRKLYPRSHLAFVGGVCLVEEIPTSLHLHVSRADQARRALKPTLRSRGGVFTDAMEVRRLRRQSLYEDVIKSLECGGVSFMLQPQVDIATGAVVGAEALARMRTPDGREIMPTSFVPLLEESGDITSLDFLVYEQVCRYLRQRLDAARPLVPVTVNISRENFKNPAFAEEFHALVCSHGLEPHHVGLEITENVFVKNLTEIRDSVRQFKQYGYCIWLDDFGAGYSSLTVLKEVPFDVIKIDRSLLGSGEIASANKSIISSVVGLSSALHMDVLCEGVENATQRNFLLGLGNIQAQGFFYARPMHCQDFNALVEGGGTLNPPQNSSR